MADSDYEDDIIAKKVKLSKNGEKGQGHAKGLDRDDRGKVIKPQVARKLRKEKRQQKLLQKLDKQSYQDSQTDLNKSLEEVSGKKKKKVTEEVTEEEEDVDEASMKTPRRLYTVSIAVAGSILDNAQTPQLKAYLAGQVARAAGIFNVDEVIVYDDTGGSSTKACELMARLLQYLETPPYLRKHLFGIHPDLQYAGLIAPLDIPHHLRKNEALPYREGIITTKPTKDGKDVSFVNVGLEMDCRVLKSLPQGTRVTVKFDSPDPSYILKAKGKLRGSIVSPSIPRTEEGYYWGYSVRIAKSLSKVFTQCPFKDSAEKGYDLTIGTSEKGSPVKDFQIPSNPPLKHVLVVFGGVEGLEYALENDETRKEDDVSALFHHYINTCPQQGSRTIRTEEAILISMTHLSEIIKNSV